MRKKVKYSWQQFQADAEKLTKQIDINKYDCIVGITRGGVFLAGMIAEITGKLELYVLGYNSYEDTNKSDSIIRTTNMHQDLHDKKILLCDDISDSGDTLFIAITDLINNNNFVEVATIHYKKGTKVIPKYVLHETDDWIDYAWCYDN